MALWKVTVKSNLVTTKFRLEKGMSIEIPSSTADPLGAMKTREQIAQAFCNKYAIDLPVSKVGHGFFDSEKM